MDKLSILFILKAEQVAYVYIHNWILFKYRMLECRKDVKQCNQLLLIRLLGLMAYTAKGLSVVMF